MSSELIPVAREFQGESDVEALVRMFAAVAAEDKDGLTVAAEDIRFEWVEDEPGWVRHLQVWEAGDHFAAAFGSWYQPDDSTARSYGELEVHPDWREPVFVDEVIQADILAVSELIDRTVEFRVGASGRQTWKQAGFERAGFVADRVFHRMSAPVTDALLEPVLPDGYRIRPMAGDTEVEEWVAAHNAGFADHYDPPAGTPEDKRTAMRYPGYLPQADLVLVDPSGRIAGIGYNAIERLTDGTAKGWVRTLAVVPEHRGRGLGRALLLASMAALRKEGMERVHLSVDTDNESGALQLYSSAGFTEDGRMIVYKRSIDPLR